MRHNQKAFLTIEYVFLMMIIIAALIGMSVYLRRSVSGRWREAADSFGYGRQYDPASSRRIDDPIWIDFTFHPWHGRIEYVHANINSKHKVSLGEPTKPEK